MKPDSQILKTGSDFQRSRIRPIARAVVSTYASRPDRSHPSRSFRGTLQAITHRVRMRSIPSPCSQRTAIAQERGHRQISGIVGFLAMQHLIYVLMQFFTRNHHPAPAPATARRHAADGKEWTAPEPPVSENIVSRNVRLATPERTGLKYDGFIIAEPA